MKTKQYLWIVIILSSITVGFCVAAVIHKIPAINAQGTRKFTPAGFEFSTTTPALKYHFPRGKYKATTFKGTWIAENAEEVRPNFVIASAETKLGAEPVAFFNITKPKGDWPKGLYRLEIRADEVLVHMERFFVQ